tara:strand:+ start:279 stop:695 length:417 start_codon:yes stop_codon:yes gene_type:complete
MLYAVRQALKAYRLKRKGLTIRLSNDKEIKKFNFKWRGINKATNILSFPNICNKDEVHANINYLGDIIISYDTLKSESSKAGLAICNHMTHILLHGILHLEGYKHKKKIEELYMQKQEIKYLKKLNITNPYIERVKIN